MCSKMLMTVVYSSEPLHFLRQKVYTKKEKKMKKSQISVYYFVMCSLPYH